MKRSSREPACASNCSTRLPRWQTTAAWLRLVCGVVMLFGLWPLTGLDLWMHLTVGRWIWAHGWVPSTDPFSYITEGQPFLAHSWLAEVVFYLVEQTAGTAGLMLLRFSLIGLALTAMLKTARLFKASWPAVMLLAPFVLGLMWSRLECRPQLFSSAFLAVTLWLIVSVHTGQRSWRWLWALPPLFAVWINLHAGWVQGVVLLVAITGALVLMELRWRWLGRGATSQLPLWSMALVLVGCLLALFINPYGARLLYFPARDASGVGSGLDTGMAVPVVDRRLAGGEWGRFRRHAATLLRLRGAGGGRLVRHRLALADGGPGTALPHGALAWAQPLAFAWGLGCRADHRSAGRASLPSEWRARPWPLLVGSGLMIGLTAVGLWSAHAVWADPREGGFRWNREEPVCVVTSVERLGLSGRFFSHPGRHLVMAFSPQHPGRLHLGVCGGTRAHRRTTGGKEGWACRAPRLLRALSGGRDRAEYRRRESRPGIGGAWVGARPSRRQLFYDGAAEIGAGACRSTNSLGPGRMLRWTVPMRLRSWQRRSKHSGTVPLTPPLPGAIRREHCGPSAVTKRHWMPPSKSPSGS